MILIKRLKGDEVHLFEVIEVSVKEKKGNNIVHYVFPTIDDCNTGEIAPGKGECVDVIDGGRRVMSVTYNKILWYGAAPK